MNPFLGSSHSRGSGQEHLRGNGSLIGPLDAAGQRIRDILGAALLWERLWGDCKRSGNLKRAWKGYQKCISLRFPLYLFMAVVVLGRVPGVMPPLDSLHSSGGAWMGLRNRIFS